MTATSVATVPDESEDSTAPTVPRPRDAAAAVVQFPQGRSRPARHVPSPADPMAVARHLQPAWERDGALILRRWRGAWWRWNESCWSEYDDADMRAWLYKRLERAEYMFVDGRSGISEPRPWSPNRGKISNLTEAAEAVTLLPSSTEMPGWTDGRPDSGTLIIPCRNGLLDLGTRRLLASTPLYFNGSATPFDYDEQAPEPREWLGFLQSLWSDDPQAIATLQEMFGYVLSGSRDLQKIFLLVGPTRSGKGTIATVLTALVGKDHTANPTLAHFATNFGVAPLIGKSLAIVPDARMPREAGGIVENLLMISGQDRMTIDRKNRDAWSGKLPLQIMILSNELPRMPDAAAAIAGRMVVLRMTRSFYGHEDRGLAGRLLASELPGIFNWSLAGLDRLTKRGRFAEPDSSLEAVDLLRESASPVKQFLEERCELGSEFTIPTDVLFTAWGTWCRMHGRDGVGTAATFARAMYAAAPGVKRTRPRDGNGSQIPTYEGVRLLPTLGWGTN